MAKSSKKEVAAAPAVAAKKNADKKAVEKSKKEGKKVASAPVSVKVGYNPSTCKLVKLMPVRRMRRSRRRAKSFLLLLPRANPSLSPKRTMMRLRMTPRTMRKKPSQLPRL